MVEAYIIPLIFYVLSLLILVYRLKTKEKNHFLISVIFIVMGSFIAYINFKNSVSLIFFLAILLSFIGDLLMARKIKFSENRTIDGAIVFGLAHITYIYAFSLLKGSSFEIGLVLGGIIVSFVLYYFIGYEKELHDLYKIVNWVYALLITMTLVSVISFSITPQVPISAIIISLLGVILFMISDGVLAFNEFKKPIKNAKDIIAVTYIMAQIFLQTVLIIIILAF